MSAALFGILAWVLLGTLGRIQEDAERLAVETTVRNMNSGLFLRQAELVTGGREADLPGLAAANPVDWLAEPPAGYVGACPPGGPAEGRWCWDAAARRLVYHPRRHGGLKTDDGLPILKWRVQAPADPKAVRPGALRVVSVGRHTWQP